MSCLNVTKLPWQQNNNAPGESLGATKHVRSVVRVFKHKHFQLNRWINTTYKVEKFLSLYVREYTKMLQEVCEHFFLFFSLTRSRLICTLVSNELQFPSLLSLHKSLTFSFDVFKKPSYSHMRAESSLGCKQGCCSLFVEGCERDGRSRRFGFWMLRMITCCPEKSREESSHSLCCAFFACCRPDLARKFN